MRRFGWIDAVSLEGAAGLLARDAGRARVIAGGQDLLGELKDRLIEPETLVNIKSLPGLDRIEFAADGSLRLGALVTLATLAGDARVRGAFPAVAQAAGSVGSVEIRNVGTVGGNLCQRPRCWYYRSPHHRCLKKGGDVCFTPMGESRYHAILGGGPSFIVHPSDLAPALAACDARVAIAGPQGAREMPIGEFYVLPSVRVDHETVLQPGDIVTGVTVPATASTAAGTRSAYVKFKEKDSFDFALAAVAAAVTLKGSTCTTARLVLGAVAPVPWRATAAETLLAGGPIDESTVGRAADAALKGAEPLGGNGYKVPLTHALIRRTLLDLAGTAPDLTPS
jgi:xanthine dehydrogenase YagS FAD-binding subunit